MQSALCDENIAALSYASYSSSLDEFRIMLAQPGAERAASEVDSAGYTLLYYFARKAFDLRDTKNNLLKLALLLKTFPDLDVSGEYVLGEGGSSLYDHDKSTNYRDVWNDEVRNATSATLFDLETIAERRSANCSSASIDEFAAMLRAHRKAQAT